MMANSIELYIESFPYKKGEPIPDLSSTLKEVKKILGANLNKHHEALLDIESQIKYATKDEIKVYYLAVKEKRRVYNIPRVNNIYDEKNYAS